MSETLHVDADRGLWLPPELRDFEKQIVFRTPRATLQHFGSGPLDPYYGMITEDSFGDPEEMRDPQNPELAPNRVSIKEQGTDAIVFEVECVVDDPGNRRAL
ncbi:hypothetical protein [Halorubrum lacusprofundi]|jgi:hypothetical protein|uniref:Uncharacterized protein n=1 Tax=Halorubrum lacusprofundi TaxID=2247 RepID=A0A220SWZ2_9EURY|nr:hypothetical protein [Halorubrum lacusprofundi]ASK38226.1 hypothetical protein [Halorubrum lacusprofundi]MCG1008076.1 hypothetical protein [Halorubrum lacusprofundi]